MRERTSNYAIQAESARAAFIKYDQEKMIRRFGLEHDDAFLYIDFFGKRHSINRWTGEVLCLADDKRAMFEAVMSIYDVLCNAKELAYISGEWRSLQNLSPHSNFGASGKSMYKREAQALSGRLEEIKKACEDLGGAPSTGADAGYIFNAFPFLPVLFQFWEGDEEFPPRLRFLFDKNTMDFMHFETAWYVAGYLLNRISERLS